MENEIGNGKVKRDVQGPILYKRRWAFLFGLSIYQFFGGISFASYGQISSFYVQFFNASHAEVDWITNARNISSIFITFPLAWMIYQGKLGLRKLVLIISVSSTLGLFLVTLSLVDRSLFVLIVAGQILCGLSESVAVAAPSTFAALWFPENQVGSAIAFNVIGICFGDGTGYTLPSVLTAPSNQTLTDGTNLTLNELASGQLGLRNMYGTFLVISAVVTIFLAIFFTDKPPTPPTFAQELKNSDSQEPRTLKLFMRDTKLLFTNPSYVMICVVIGLIFQLALIENMMMSEIIATTGLPFNGTSDQLSGYVMAMFSIGGIPGMLIGGKLVDRCKRFKLLSIFGNTTVLLSTAALAVSVLLKNSVGMFVSNALFGFFTGTVSVVLFEMATQLTYPVDETLVNTWMTGIQMTIALFLGLFGRLTFDNWGSGGVLFFQCACVVFALFLCCLVSSRNRRLEVGSRDEENQHTMHSPLIPSH